MFQNHSHIFRQSPKHVDFSRVIYVYYNIYNYDWLILIDVYVYVYIYVCVFINCLGKFQFSSMKCTSYSQDANWSWVANSTYWLLIKQPNGWRHEVPQGLSYVFLFKWLLSWVKSTIFGADPYLRCFYLHPCLFVVETCFIFRQFPCFLNIHVHPFGFVWK